MIKLRLTNKGNSFAIAGHSRAQSAKTHLKWDGKNESNPPSKSVEEWITNWTELYLTYTHLAAVARNINEFIRKGYYEIVEI